ncbi:hypothetical protein SSPO_004240 [Streptomyces antimycoticus]|uniref:Beta-lactamase-related domain-containing protein n=1 Tax=Streptomyces antimycoticus TaxID=68175 RepID=A0A499ULR6_9ACTN|nr:serine hydrolase domain-containing protein [Streptomyces antimycoticus]BBJ37706.1 hypothetical protein SSPO_004240 [Streptomyces antimycoticus]
MSRQQSSRRLLIALAVAAVALGTLTATTAAPAGPPHHAPPRLHPDAQAAHAKTQAVLNEIVAQGTPGVIARIQDARGVWDGRAGVGDLVAERFDALTDNTSVDASKRPRSTSEKFRIASVTKTFTATVLLGLEAEGRISLDDSVERWLPGVVRGKGYRPGNITVRRLLNHTSGIFDYNMDKGFRTLYAGDEFDRNRHTRWSPEELVDIALAHPPNFQPEQGSRPGRPGRWDYSDTNYILAGMIAEKATGGTYAQAVERLVIRPLGLRGMSVPDTSPRLPAPHARHYSTLFEDGPEAKVRDVTEFSPTVAFSAGQMISTVGDVNTFLS